MLALKILGSSSKGNSYLLKDCGKNIMIDCGVKDVVEKVDISKVSGILISHQHLDHCRDCKNIKNYYKGYFYSNKETLEVLPIIDVQKMIVEENTPFKIGNFNIVAFSVYHDVPNYGYLLKHIPSGIKILYIIDTSSITNLHFKDIDIFIIEANHSYVWLEEKETLDAKDYRTFGEKGHMAVEDTLEFLKENINCNTKKVILTHISRQCENYLEMEDIIKTGINNTDIEVIAINPHLEEPLEIVLKKDIDINFD